MSFKTPAFLKSIFSPHPWTLISALLIVVAFPPWDYSYFIWFALIPWLWKLDEISHSPIPLKSAVKKASLQGLWLSIFMTLGGYYWVASVLQHFGNLPWSLSVIGLLIFSTFNQIQFVIFSLVYVLSNRSARFKKWKTQHQSTAILAVTFLAVFYTAIDSITPKIFIDTFGHSQFNRDFIRQLADLSGIQPLTFLIILHNLGLKEIISSRLQWRKKELYHYALPCGLLLMTLTYGYWRKNQVQEIQNQASDHIQIGLIQPGIGDIDKLAAKTGNHFSAAYKIMQNLEELSLASAGHLNDQGLSPDAIVWPETSYPNLFRNPRSPFDVQLDQWVMKILGEINRPLLFGGYDHTDNPDKEYNAFFFLNPQSHPRGEDLQVYRKNILLPFGEYIPGADLIPWVKEQFPQVGYFGKGNGAEAFTVELPQGRRMRFNPIICYEALFADFISQGSADGGEFILNITNDSWFGPYGEPYLHLALSVFRGIEVRRPQVRSTNTGISALIDSTGEIRQKLGVGERGFMNVSVPIHQQIPTLYSQMGDWFSVLIRFLAIIFCTYFLTPVNFVDSKRPSKS